MKNGSSSISSSHTRPYRNKFACSAVGIILIYDYLITAFINLALWRRNWPQPDRMLRFNVNLQSGVDEIWSWLMYESNRIKKSHYTHTNSHCTHAIAWKTAQFSASQSRDLFSQIKLTEINYSARIQFKLFRFKASGNQVHISESIQPCGHAFTHTAMHTYGEFRVYLAAMLSFLAGIPLCSGTYGSVGILIEQPILFH